MVCSVCDWDPEKERESFRKHGISFDVACCVFGDPHREEVEDDGDYGEVRWIATGMVETEILVVVYTERNGVERIITARKAAPQEERAYYARLRWPKRI
jgi:uncharacterized DUF497 family protein